MELSRVEQILKYFLGEADTLPQPLSRVEELLIALGHLIEEGTVSNPISIRGIVSSVSELPVDATPGWMYFVGPSDADEYSEYIYLDSGRWEYLGTSMIDIDTALNSSSTNPVQNKAVTAAINLINQTLADAIAKKPGEIATGKRYTIDGQTVTAGEGAEVFNSLTNNKAAGNYSHAEGSVTTAYGRYSHAEGGGTIAYGDNSHAEGAGTTASGSNSHAEGAGTTASGSNSHAEGASATASRQCSHAEGFMTTASGDQSHAESFRTTASGSNSHAEGAGTMASGAQSHAEGDNTKASSTNQHVQGKYNVEDTDGAYAFIIGNGTADKVRHNAFAIDWNGLIYVNGSSTGVDLTKKPGEITKGKQYTIDGHTVTAAEGAEVFNSLTGNKASGPFSHAEGGGTTALGYCSHAEGVGTKASGAQSHAEGGGSTALGYCSHAEGDGTTASGSNSHAEGAGSIASGNNSHAEGQATKASSENQHVQGKYNDEDANGKYAFIIGNGAADQARHNAFAIDWNGLIYVNGAATGVDVSQCITPTDYATQTNGGTIKAWTTTDGSDTILHLATQ